MSAKAWPCRQPQAGHVTGMAEDSRVSFIVAGVQKAGTTGALRLSVGGPGTVAVPREGGPLLRRRDAGLGSAGLRRLPRQLHALGRPAARARPPRSISTGRTAWRGSPPTTRLCALSSSCAIRWNAPGRTGRWNTPVASRPAPSPGASARAGGGCSTPSPGAITGSTPMSSAASMGEQLEAAFRIFPLQPGPGAAGRGPEPRPRHRPRRLRDFLALPPREAPLPRQVHVAREMDYGSELTPEDAGFLRALYATDQARLQALTGIAFTRLRSSMRLLLQPSRRPSDASAGSPMRPVSLAALLVLASVGAAHAAAPQAAAPAFALPLACQIGRTCEIQHYFDRDPRPPRFATTHAAGAPTTATTASTIRILDMAAQRAGVDVLAAAPGRVARLRDGVADISIRAPGAPSVAGQECGNGVVVDHGNGWENPVLPPRPGQRAGQGRRRGGGGNAAGQGPASRARRNFRTCTSPCAAPGRWSTRSRRIWAARRPAPGKRPCGPP